MDNKPGPMQTLDYVRRFAMSLRRALHDISHEDCSSARVFHFWDSDSLWLPVRGLPAIDKNQKYQDQRDLIAQALLAAGCLGRVCLVAPHRNELLGLIATMDPSKRDIEQENARRNILAEPEMMPLRELSEFISACPRLDEYSAEKALAKLRALSTTDFVYAQACAGSWQARLTELVNTRPRIDLGLFGPETGAILEQSDIFDGFATRISSIRHDGRRLATAIDAAALTSIAMMNHHVYEDEYQQYPRFFTSSSSLQKLRKDPWVINQLSFEIENEGELERDSVWRDGDYYFVRSLFPSLRILIPGEQRQQSELEELRKMSHELSAVLAGDSSGVLKFVNSVALSDHSSLSDIIEEFEGSRLSRLWSRLHESPNSIEILASLKRLFQAEQTFSMFTQFEGSLQSSLQAHFVARKIGTQIIDALKDARTILGVSGYGELSLTKDFASIRWGLEYDEVSDKLELNESGELSVKDIFLVNNIETVVSEQKQSTRMLAILFGLEKFDLAYELFGILQVKESSPAVNLMLIIAQLMVHGNLSENLLDVLVNECRRIWDTFDDDIVTRTKYALSYGYALYAAWNRSDLGGAFESRVRDDKGWARESIRVVMELRSHMSEWEYTYGVNHVVYVATRSRLNVEDLDVLAVDLEGAANKTGNFRFLDTVGLYLVKKCANEIPGQTVIPDVKYDVASRGFGYLQRAASLVPNDNEVRIHLEYATKVMRSIK